MVLGIAGVLFLFIPGWPRIAGVLASAAGVTAAIMFRRRDRALRAGLDREGITDRFAEMVPAPSSGLIQHEIRGVHASLPSSHVVVDLVDALRAGPAGFADD